MVHFSKKQELAITHGEGPMLVIAGPGSGKTTVLTHRVQDLIIHQQVRPEDILVITFTKAAAVEMESRFTKLVGRKLPVSFGTFHSVFFRILRTAYHYSVDSIIQDEERRRILTEACVRYHLDQEDGPDFLNALTGEISRVKGEGLDIRVYNSAHYPAEEFRKVYQYYEKALRDAKRIDFDDMLVQCRELLTRRRDILQSWQARYRYILIDEFQDINRIQYEVIRNLALPENNLFVVGDDDQSIYGFRGSKPEIMLQFEQDFPTAEKVVLDENYRCCANIVKAADRVIQHNQVRFAKDIHTANDEGARIDIVEFATNAEEYERIVAELRNAVAAGGSYRDAAILYRTNAVAEPLVRKLMEMNIPFSLKEGIPNIFDHWIANDLIAYMRLAAGGRERADFLRIANKPLRYIGRDYLTDRQIDLTELEKYYEEKPWMMERIHRLHMDLRLMNGMSPYAAINYLRKGMDYNDYLKSYAQEHDLAEQDLYDIAEEIQQSAKEKKTIPEWLTYIEEYSRKLRESNRRRADADEEVVTLTTMHSAKGLEYETVFLIDANEGITPHKKSTTAEQIEEERRMFYVAMTRAKKRLHIYYTDERYNHKQEPSRFVLEIMDED